MGLGDPGQGLREIPAFRAGDSLPVHDAGATWYGQGWVRPADGDWEARVMRARWLARAAFVLMLASAAVLIGFPARHARGAVPRWRSGRSRRA